MKVSIITPAYNTRPSYIREYLESIMAQTFQDFRIIFINDGTEKYDYSFLKNHPKILYLENEKNIGIPASLNIAYSYVDSEYIVRFDSDDKFHPSLLQREVEFLDSNPNYIGVCTDFQKFGYRRGIFRRVDDWTIESAANGNDLGFAISMMFRSSVLEKTTTDESLPMCEDFDFHIQLLQYGKIKVIHEPLYYYRKHPEQITRRISKEDRKRYYNQAVNHAKRILEKKNG